MANIILTHGAWQGAWAWKFLTPELLELGHCAQALDLSSNPHDDQGAPNASLAQYVEVIHTQLRNAADPVYLVAHSMGGIPATIAASLIPDKIARLIYISAFAPNQGDTLISLSQLIEPKHPLPLVFNEAQTSASIKPDEIVSTFFHDATSEKSEWAKSHFSSQPLSPLVTPSQLDLQSINKIAREYVVCLADRAVEEQLQRKMAERVGCNKIHEIDSSHCPFISQPENLAKLIDKIIKSPS